MFEGNDFVECRPSRDGWECAVYGPDVPEVGGYSVDAFMVDNLRLRDVPNIDTSGKALEMNIGTVECDIRATEDGEELFVCANDIDREYGGSRLTAPY